MARYCLKCGNKVGETEFYCKGCFQEVINAVARAQENYEDVIYN